jgi:DNA-binding transcriptional ArsR family regulator
MDLEPASSHASDPRADLLALLKALADPGRLRLAGLLASRERNVSELAALLELREPTVSHHLAILRDAGLVSLRADRNIHWYRLEPRRLHELSRALMSGRNLERIAAGADGDAAERRVLRNYLDGERLTKIPDVRGKRIVVLKWLARKFAPDRAYSEADVNAILKRHHEDVATLRREMIGCDMLERSRGIYHRLPEAKWRGQGGKR